MIGESLNQSVPLQRAKSCSPKVLEQFFLNQGSSVMYKDFKWITKTNQWTKSSSPKVIVYFKDLGAQKGDQERLSASSELKDLWKIGERYRTQTQYSDK